MPASSGRAGTILSNANTSVQTVPEQFSTNAPFLHAKITRKFKNKTPRECTPAKTDGAGPCARPRFILRREEGFNSKSLTQRHEDTKKNGI
jgi:hypothetical protein